MSAVVEIPLTRIDRNPKQPREVFPEEHIARLADSIAARGLLQPITLRPVGRRYMIVAGECRYRAHERLGAKTIKAIVQKMDEREMQLLAIVENLQRKDMNPIEEAKAFKALLDAGYTADRIMAELGLRSTSLVKQRIDLLDLDEGIQKLVSSQQLSVNMAWGVALAPKHLQTKLLREIQSGRLKTSEEVKHAGIAMRDAAAQTDAFAHMPAPSKKDLAAISGLEHKIDEMICFVQAGFKNGECIAAQRVSPDRVKTMVEKLTLIRKHILQMEHSLRCVATQSEIKLEVAS